MKLRKELYSAPVLAFPRVDRPFVLHNDASNTSIGGILSQLNDERHVIAFVSHTLSKSECLCCVTCHKLLAVVVFVQHFRPYLLGQDVT